MQRVLEQYKEEKQRVVQPLPDVPKPPQRVLSEDQQRDILLYSNNVLYPLLIAMVECRELRDLFEENDVGRVGDADDEPELDNADPSTEEFKFTYVSGTSGWQGPPLTAANNALIRTRLAEIEAVKEEEEETADVKPVTATTTHKRKHEDSDTQQQQQQPKTTLCSIYKSMSEIDSALLYEQVLTIAKTTSDFFDAMQDVDMKFPRDIITTTVEETGVTRVLIKANTLLFAEAVLLQACAAGEIVQPTNASFVDMFIMPAFLMTKNSGMLKLDDVREVMVLKEGTVHVLLAGHISV